MPNFNGRYLKGFGANTDAVGTYGTQTLPNITGDAYNTNQYGGAGYWNTRTGAFKQASTGSINYISGDYAIQGGPYSNSTLGFDASLSNSVYGNYNVNPYNVVMMVCIKY